jgi:hypothetical protein
MQVREDVPVSKINDNLKKEVPKGQSSATAEHFFLTEGWWEREAGNVG